MLNHPNKYFNRQTCNQFIEKFGIKSFDSIQLFNKIEQLGIKTSSTIGDKGEILYTSSIWIIWQV